MLVRDRLTKDAWFFLSFVGIAHLDIALVLSILKEWKIAPISLFGYIFETIFLLDDDTLIKNANFDLVLFKVVGIAHLVRALNLHFQK